MKQEFHRKFTKELSRLSHNKEESFYERLALLLDEPDHPLLSRHPLHGKFAGCWSIDISGDLRAVYEVHDDTYFFIHIGTHHQLFGT